MALNRSIHDLAPDSRERYDVPVPVMSPPPLVSPEGRAPVPTKKPVSERRKGIAVQYGLHNVECIALVCREAGVPFYVACALFEKESGGRNIYGHDAGGALSGFPLDVCEGNYGVFEWLVFTKGQTSNGVGPSQITYKGFFTQMKAQGLKPWDVHDNMLFGLKTLGGYFAQYGSWTEAGHHYNGATVYGVDLAHKIEIWKQRFAS
jgi:hypothetical protein